MAEESGSEKRVLFGAEFDGQKIVDGVDDVIAGLQKAKEAQEELGVEISNTKDIIEEQTKALEEMKKKQAAVSKASKEGQKEFNALGKEITLINDSNAQLNDDLVNLEKQYKKNAVTIKDYSKVVKDNEKAQQSFGKAVSKVTDVNAIATAGVKKLGDFVKNTAIGLISGFAGGIASQVIPVLIDYVAKMFDASEEVQKLMRNQKTLNEVLEGAAKSVGGEAARLTIIKEKLNDLNIPQADRIRIAKEYNKTADETNKIDLKQIDNLVLLNAQIDKQNKLIVARAVSTAALSKLTAAASDLVEVELKLGEALRTSGTTVEAAQKRVLGSAERNKTAFDQATKSLDGYGSALQRNADITVKTSKSVALQASKEDLAITSLVTSRELAQRDLDEMVKLLSPLITPDGLTTKGTKGGAGKQDPENVFQRMLAELNARLAAQSGKVFQSEPIIRRIFEQQLEKEFQNIAELIKNKKLTIAQGDILKGLIEQINAIDLSKSLEEFRAKVKAAIQRINDTIQTAGLEAETLRINNLKEQFEREALIIDNNYTRAVEQIQARSRDFLQKVDEDVKTGLVSPELAKRKKFIALLMFGALVDEQEQARVIAQSNLGFRIFQDQLQKIQQQAGSINLEASEENTQAIREQTALYLQGQINYATYQKRLTEILKKESKNRIDIDRETLEKQLKLVTDRLATTTDPEQKKQLEQQAENIRKSIDAINRSESTGEAADVKARRDARIQAIVDYANAYQALANTIVTALNQVAAAEQASLDRSIALQNKRVENAREIAEKGNAEYLELEEKRLDELERKRDANARKQLAINNALVASQAIVAAIGAIAAAVTSGSPLAGIAALGSVIGAIAAAYSFVDSLQPQTANFYEGTPYVDGRGGRSKKDGVKANLHVGESVVTATNNEKYWDTMKAIHNNTIPPEVLNDFVNTYPKFNLPSVDYDRLEVATNGKMGADSREMLHKLDTLDSTMHEVVAVVGKIAFEVNMDQDGFSAALRKHIRKTNLRSKS